MFGGNIPFGSQTQSLFGQSNNTSTNPFAPKPFGSSTPFGSSQIGNSMFGNNSTGVFGVPQASSPFGVSAFSNPGQNSFGFSTPQSSPFGTTNMNFGVPTTPAFGVFTTPAFSNNAFSPSSSSAFNNNAFSASSAPAFSNNGFGSGGAFAASSAPAFSNNVFGSGGAFATSSSPAFSNNGFGSTNVFSTTKPNPFGQNTSTTTKPNPFGQNTSTTPNPFAQNTSTTSIFSSPSIFGPNSSTTTNVFGPATTPSQSTSTFSFSSSTPAFISSETAPSHPLFPSSSSSNPGFSSSPSTFARPAFNAFATTPSFASSSSTSIWSNPASTSAFSFNNSQTQSSPLFSSNSSNGQNTNPTISFSSPSTGMGNLFSSTPSSTTTISPFSSFTPNQSSQPTQNGNASGMGLFSQVSASTNSFVTQPLPVTNPFGTLPALPPIQYGISSRPVVDLPAPARMLSPLLTSRNISQRRVRPLPVRKYRPGDDGPRVAFFNDEEYSNTPKADAFLVPRENPRALFIRPVEKAKSALPKENGKSGKENVESSNKVANRETRDAPLVKANQKPNGTREEDQRGDKDSSPSDAEIESLMPKLHDFEYFTEPRIQELAAKERVDPGYCSRVRDFVVGRHGYGNIKFVGETDVRKLDLKTMVQFNNREVLVYMDESKKPPVGKELNKPAEVTLLNIKVMDKKSRTQVKEGSRVDKFREILKRKAEEQGAEFVSYDAVNGQWKFRVEHF